MGGKTKTKTVRTPYDAAAVANANSTLGNANTAAQNKISGYMPTLDKAIGKITANMESPPAYLTGARDQLAKTINGDFIGANPHTGGIADLIAKKTQGNYNASFGAAGRSHGGLAALLSSQGVGDALGSFYNDVYQGERGLQQQAIMAAPAFHQDEYTDINTLFPAVNNAAMMPLTAANAYGQGVTTVNSPYTTDTTTQKQSMGLGGILGGALQLGGALLPMGGGLGGLLGGAGSAGGMASTLGRGAATSMGTIATAPMRFLG